MAKSEPGGSSERTSPVCWNRDLDIREDSKPNFSLQLLSARRPAMTTSCPKGIHVIPLNLASFSSCFDRGGATTTPPLPRYVGAIVTMTLVMRCWFLARRRSLITVAPPSIMTLLMPVSHIAFRIFSHSTPSSLFPYFPTLMTSPPTVLIFSMRFSSPLASVAG